MPFLPTSSVGLPHAPWRQAPLFRYALWLVCGISVAWGLRDNVSAWMWATMAITASVISILSYCLKLECRSWRVAVVAASLAVAASGATWLQISYDRMQTTWPDKPRLWHAQVQRIHTYRSGMVQADLQLFGTDSRHSGRSVRAYIRPVKNFRLRAADAISFYAQIGKPFFPSNPGDFDYGTYLQTHGISGTVYVDTFCVRPKIAASCALSMRFLRWRDGLLDSYARFFDGQTLAVISALTLGDRTCLSSETRNLFAETGTSHVLALSGLHLAILFGLLHRLLLRRLHRRIYYMGVSMLAVMALWLFVLLAGAPLSLVRAATMLTLYQLGNAINRTRNATLNHLSLAAIVLLMFQPMALFDVGFQLSFVAVASIHFLWEYVWRRIPFPEWNAAYELGLFGRKGVVKVCLQKYLYGFGFLYLRLTVQKQMYRFFRTVLYPFFTVSLSAQLGTLPLVLYYFHVFTPYALWANVVVIPSAYVLLAGALLFFAVPLSGVQMVVSNVLQAVVEWMTSGLQFFTTLPGATFRVYPTTVSLLLITCMPVLIYAALATRLRKHRCLLLSAFAGCLFVLTGVEIYRLCPTSVPSQIIVYNLPKIHAIHFVKSAEKSYIYASTNADTLNQRLNYVRKNFFEPKRIHEPRFLNIDKYSDKDLLRVHNYFVFGSVRVWDLNEKFHPVPSLKKLPLKLLLVGKGCRDSLPQILPYLRPQQVVLTSDLSGYYRRRWAEDCRAAHIPCHDVRLQGAYVYVLP